MKTYLDLVRDILDRGEEQADRTGTGTRTIFGASTRYDLREGFPILTTKRVRFKSVAAELEWFLKGSTNINDGLKQKTGIWNAWAKDDGDVGPIYGFQWRRWGEKVCDRCNGSGRLRNQDVTWIIGSLPNDCDQPCSCRNGLKVDGIDQLRNVVEALKTSPNSRRMIVSAWNVADLDAMALPPCHMTFQFYAPLIRDGETIGRYLDCVMYQRSADMALGVPFNIASYALLMHVIAREVRYRPRYFVHHYGNAHIYNNHVNGLREQLDRPPKELPMLVLAPECLGIDSFKSELASLQGYDPHPAIKFEVSV